jgi:hypothetical protein
VEFVEGVDYEAATAQLNSLAEDFHLDPRPWYNDPSLRIGSATKESLERLFGWRVKRVPLPPFRKDQIIPGYMWGEVSPPIRYPVEGIIHVIEMSQPGADDNGQWYE